MFRLPVREVLSVGLALALAAAVPSRSPAFAQVPESLLTVAEKSRFQATSRHAEVVALCDNLAKAYPRVITRGELGQSGEGRTLPLLFLANPPVTTPQAAHASGKLVVFLFGNIHAGEVDGKEALPILAREVASVPDHPLLRDLILAIAPIYNADGNERVSKDNRPGQVGPAEGMGVRTNAQGLDLNRDAMKLEAPETRALVKFLNEWDPHMVVDTHTTNGSYHRYAMTYEGAKNPAGDRRLITFTRQKMFPDLTRALEQRSGAKSYFYGNFEGDHTRWTSFPSSPRFGTTYVGLRNRLSILTEAYSYISYEARVKVTHDFVLEALLFLAGHKDEVKYELDRARKSTVVAGEDPRPSPARPRCLASSRSAKGGGRPRQASRGITFAPSNRTSSPLSRSRVPSPTWSRRPWPKRWRSSRGTASRSRRSASPGRSRSRSTG
jgi:hypothetical protein